MSWDFDEREMVEAVKEGDVDFLLAGYRAVCIERDEARRVAVAARDFVDTLKSTGLSHRKLDALQASLEKSRPVDWEAVAHLNADSWARLQSKYMLALSLMRRLRERHYTVVPALAQEKLEAYEAILALIDGWTQITNPEPDAWPVRWSTSMILKPHLRVINAALAHKGRRTI
jgi:hypothetical protein